MYEDKRIVTVTNYHTSKYCTEKNSRISLQGKWLGELGFAVGRNVSVTVENENNNPQLIVKLI
jgi:hypothetical protein